MLGNLSKNIRFQTLQSAGYFSRACSSLQETAWKLSFKNIAGDIQMLA